MSAIVPVASSVVGMVAGVIAVSWKIMTLLKNHLLTDSSTCKLPGMQKLFLPSNRESLQIDSLEFFFVNHRVQSVGKLLNRFNDLTRKVEG